MSGEVAVAGIDGARGGWVVCRVEVGSGMVTLRAAATLDELWDDGWVVVGIDMPMGLPSVGPRGADAEARRLLGRRHMTLFPTPVHATLAAVEHADANVRSRAASGRGISVQAYNLLPRVRELRTFLGAPRAHVHEVHPETSFTVMNGGQPLESKHTAPGRAARANLLTRWRSPDDGWDARTVDELDAGAAAWTAERVTAGEHLQLGTREVDPDGYPLTMVV